MNSLSTRGNKAVSQALLSACLAGGVLVYSAATTAAGADQQRTDTDYQATSNAEQQQAQQSGQQQWQQQDEQRQTQQQQESAMGQRERSTDQAEAPDAVVSIVAITEVPVVDLEQLIDQEVINYEGENIGDVEKIVTNPDGTINGLIIGSGGFLGMAETELFVPADELQVTTDHVVWQTPLDQDALEKASQYQVEQYTAIE